MRTGKISQTWLLAPPVIDLNIIAPFSFIVSGLIVYWSTTPNVVKLDIAVLFFLILYFVARRLDSSQAPIDFRAGFWMVPWILGLTVFALFGGSYVKPYPAVFRIKITHHPPALFLSFGTGPAVSLR